MARRCPNCFNTKKDGGAICPFCKYDENVERSRRVLPYWTPLLGNRYWIGRVLGEGGFGITYKAWDTKRREPVAVKEFLPLNFAERGQSGRRVVCGSRDAGDFRQWLGKFLDEARILVTLNSLGHRNLVRVRKYFEENGTGYMVMDYYRGMDLGQYLKRLPERRMTEENALAVMGPVMDGLRAVHGLGIVHRDIKPANIYLAEMRNPVLLDFGAARQAMGERSRTLTRIYSEGYAPVEQYYGKGRQGPWTDVYGCAAVLYRLVSGVTPRPAWERVNRDGLPPLAGAVPGVSPAFSEAVRRGLAVKAADRPQTMAEFQGMLRREEPVEIPDDPPPLDDPPPEEDNDNGEPDEWTPSGSDKGSEIPKPKNRQGTGTSPILWVLRFLMAAIAALLLGLWISALVGR